MIISDFGLSVSYGSYRATVIAPIPYANNVCGLCGDWDGIKNNDYTIDLAAYQEDQYVGVE